MKPNTKVTIARIPVQSSQIESLGHDPVGNTLEIEFKNGDVYRYANFHADSFEELKSAPSIGSYFIKRIKPRPDKFPYVKMGTPEAEAPADPFAKATTTEQSDPTGVGEVKGSDINTPVIPDNPENQDKKQEGTEDDPDGDRTNRIEGDVDNRTIAQKAADQKAGAGTSTRVMTAKELEDENTIPELEKIAEKENINLGGATLKHDIATAIVKGRKAKSKSERESPEPPERAQVI